MPTKGLDVVPYKTMSNDFFIKVVNQVIEMGYKIRDANDRRYIMRKKFSINNI